MKVEILDAVMGTGKSTEIINRVNDSPDTKYIILVPLLTEVERYKEALSSSEKGKRSDIVALDTKESETKTQRFLDAVQEGKTVIASHALFSLLSSWDLSGIPRGEYELIIDETIMLVERGELKDEDIQVAEKSGLIEKSEHPSIEWLEIYEMLPAGEAHIGKNGALSSIVKAVQGKHIYSVANRKVVFVVPPEKFEVFNSITILTYLFKGSETNGWLEVFKIPFEHLELYKDSAGGLKTKAHIGYYDGAKFKKLLDIYEGPYNDVGKKEPRAKGYPVGKKWFDQQMKKRKGGALPKLKNDTRSFFRNSSRGNEDNLWTCFKDHIEVLRDNHFSLKGTGEYPQGYLTFNTRATNDYADKHVLAFLLNINPFPEIELFFKAHGATFDKDNYALSVVLQWVWRSAIRNGDPVKLFLPSERMRSLVQDWLIDFLLRILAKPSKMPCKIK
ncbi:hypothetical protein [Desulfopila aestuarii]|uniref:DEAD/DEAH box helicase n=1 Tax=Desulfopila aestuarii DSM 18488 TaxID=1121416 RepID=A0A1M7YH40_9BACT|nr:hypothetical protein [Desulfopila aestuarii]SHO51952.1 hypothetical protein SAMN02745220_04299 [Desulfopila aestuarii DSM 18488]